MDLGKQRPDEATSTHGRHSIEAYHGCATGMLAHTAACGHATGCKMHTCHLQPSPAGCVGRLDGERAALENQRALCTASASCDTVPHELGGGASCSVHCRDEINNHGMTPQSHEQTDRLIELDSQHCNQAAPDTPSNSLQHSSPSQEEHAGFPSMQSYGHEAHDCCQHESHRPSARPVPLATSARAAATEGQWPSCSDRAAENDIANTPGSSSSSLGKFVMAAEQGAPVRARPRSSMVFEVA